MSADLERYRAVKINETWGVEDLTMPWLFVECSIPDMALDVAEQMNQTNGSTLFDVKWEYRPRRNNAVYS